MLVYCFQMEINISTLLSGGDWTPNAFLMASFTKPSIWHPEKESPGRNVTYSWTITKGAIAAHWSIFDSFFLKMLNDECFTASWRLRLELSQQLRLLCCGYQALEWKLDLTSKNLGINPSQHRDLIFHYPPGNEKAYPTKREGWKIIIFKSAGWEKGIFWRGNTVDGRNSAPPGMVLKPCK